MKSWKSSEGGFEATSAISQGSSRRHRGRVSLVSGMQPQPGPEIPRRTEVRTGSNRRVTRVVCRRRARSTFGAHPQISLRRAFSIHGRRSRRSGDHVRRTRSIRLAEPPVVTTRYGYLVNLHAVAIHRRIVRQARTENPQGTWFSVPEFPFVGVLGEGAKQPITATRPEPGRAVA